MSKGDTEGEKEQKTTREKKRKTKQETVVKEGKATRDKARRLEEEYTEWRRVIR